MKKALLSAILSIALCVSLIVGSTFALFVTESKVNVAVTSANIDVTATVRDGSMKTYSYDRNSKTVVEQATRGSFAMGGTAVAEKNQVTLADATPGDKVTFTIDVVNNSTVTVMWRTCVKFIDDTGLAEALDVFAGGEQISLEGNYSKWQTLDIKDSASQGNVAVVEMVIDFPYEEGDQTKYMGKSCTVVYTVEAVQGNAKVEQADVWDGTADTSWYNDTDTEFTLATAEQFAGFAELVDGGNTFAGKTLKLDSDLDLNLVDDQGDRVSFDPIGYGYDVVFKGTFDGQGHTISNLYQNGWALGYDYSTEGGGLFASVVDATIKNVNIDGAEVVMECIDMGVLVGYSYGNCTYENISVSNSSVANYQRYTGGVVGEVNGTQVFKNVDVTNTVIGSMWGDFDASVGGIVGGKWGDAKLTFIDCDVECRLDVYNDVVSAARWYAYRRAGMLIGNTEESVNVNGTNVATASFLTAENCTVTYGDWVNYTYCQFSAMPYPYVRVEAGEHSDVYTNPRYDRAKDANGNDVVDANHVHNDGEDHHMLLKFDQLFGGAVGVYGGTTHDGVTVNYNNK